jgi:hypothetical protein
LTVWLNAIDLQWKEPETGKIDRELMKLPAASLKGASAPAKN